MAPSFAYGDDGPGGVSCIRIGDTVLPCPGVALRLSAVIDCTPSEERMPPITIDFLKAPPPQHGAAASPLVTGRYTCNTGDFVLINQLLHKVAAMVADAGLPRECAASVNAFLLLSASSAANSFYKAMAVTVEASDPGSTLLNVEEGGGQAAVPPGAEAGECAICYTEYLVGGAPSVTPPCGHTFRSCLDRWTAVNRSCPYCRRPVPTSGEARGRLMPYRPLASLFHAYYL